MNCLDDFRKYLTWWNAHEFDDDKIEIRPQGNDSQPATSTTDRTLRSQFVDENVLVEAREAQKKIDIDEIEEKEPIEIDDLIGNQESPEQKHTVSYTKDNSSPTNN